MPTEPKTFLTPEQYLEIERKAEFKSEYYRGEMFPMPRDVSVLAVPQETHSLLVVNIVAALHSQLRSRAGRIYSHDIRVGMSESVEHVPPDVMAVRGQPRFLDDRRDTLLNPTLIVEVLSPSTEASDRGRKFHLYQTIESFSDYLLVASDRVHVDLFTRQPDGWHLTSADRLEDTLDLPSIGCRLPLSDLYEQVDFTEK